MHDQVQLTLVIIHHNVEERESRNQTYRTTPRRTPTSNLQTTFSGPLKHKTSLLRVRSLSLARALRCPSLRPLGVGRSWSVRAGPPPALVVKCCPWLPQGAPVSPVSAPSRSFQSLCPRSLPNQRSRLTLLPCPRLVVRPSVCIRPSPSRLVRTHLTPPRLDGAAVPSAADVCAIRGRCCDVPSDAHEEFLALGTHALVAPQQRQARRR